MLAEYNENIFQGYLVQGNLHGGMEYLQHFPEKKELYSKYISLFEEESYPVFEDDSYLNELLTSYQKYYRDVFYLGMEEERAAERMWDRFADFFDIAVPTADMGEVEYTYISSAFTDRGFHFLGGKTSGYFGPYIWKTTEARTYEVELPGGAARYTVNLLDGFISRSWLDFLSFGEIGTGGWTDGDGIINCVKKSYDLDSEDFRVSLLKHEAQHAVDLAQFENMSSENLEYRAKLVELIYSSQRNLLQKFLCEADGSDRDNGHSRAAARIAKGFSQKLNISRERLETLSVTEIQDVARELFAESDREMLRNIE